MPSVPQIKCPQCKTMMPYTAAACPNCKRRMVTVTKSTEPYKTPEERAAEWSPKWADGQPPPSNKGLIGGIISAGILVVIVAVCCSSGNQTPEERRAIEMQPVRDEMQRKMSEGKTKEQAAQEIINEEVLRQEINKMANQKK